MKRGAPWIPLLLTLAVSPIFATRVEPVTDTLPNGSPLALPLVAESPQFSLDRNLHRFILRIILR